MDTAFREQFRFLARYNRWFNQRLYDACEQLSDEERKRDRGAFFGSLGVVFAALPAPLLALPPGSDYTSDLHPDWSDLRRNRAALDEAIEAWTQEMAADFPLSTMRYANTKGVPREHPAWQALTHFFNHQAHHRGQVTTLLMQAGIDPGVTDLVALI
jgi:uncharacterized damage-inducible protein DinB